MNKPLKTLKEAMSSLNRALALLEAKDHEIAKLRERIAMMEWAHRARTQLERAKPATEMIQ